MWRRLLALFFALFAFCLPCFGEEISFDRELADIAESLPNEVEGLLPEGFFDSVDNAAAGLDETLELPFWKELLGELFYDRIGQALPTVTALLGLVLVSALLSAFKDVMRSDALAGAVNLAVSVVMTSIFVNAASRHIELVTSYAQRLSELTRAMLPLMGALLAMGGSGASAVATHGGVLMVLGVVEAVVGEAFGGIGAGFFG